MSDVKVEYSEFVNRLKSQDYLDIARRLSHPEVIDALHALIGLTSEVGELADALKKHVFYGQDVDVPNVHEELGDVRWYYQLMANAFSFDTDKIKADNVAKLSKRYPGLFFNEIDAKLRKDKEESEEMSPAVTVGAEIPTATLSDWRAYRGIDDEYYSISGKIYGDQKRRFEDGEQIKTSKISREKFPADQLVAGSVVKTQNSTYKLGIPMSTSNEKEQVEEKSV